MRRWIYTYEIVDGDPERLEMLLLQKLPELLQAATGSPMEPRAVDGSLRLTLDADVAGMSAVKTVRMHTGVAARSGARLCVPVTWHAEPGKRAYPRFDGNLELQPMSSRTAQLTLAGSYTVPLGMVGAVMDSLALHAVAERTAAALVRGLAEALEEQTGSPEPPIAESDAEAVSAAGERLILQVRDVMTPHPIVLHEDLPLRQAAMLLLDRGISGAPVVASDGTLIGVLSEQDLIEKEALAARGVGPRTASSRRRKNALTVGEACSRPARVTFPEAPVRAAAREMLDHGVARLVVVDASAVAGIVTRHDVLHALVRDDAEILTLVRRILAALAERDVRATVHWGRVTLSGVARLRSRIPDFERFVGQIDGVGEVISELAWHSDDVQPSATAMTAP